MYGDDIAVSNGITDGNIFAKPMPFVALSNFRDFALGVDLTYEQLHNHTSRSGNGS